MHQLLVELHGDEVLDWPFLKGHMNPSHFITVHQASPNAFYRGRPKNPQMPPFLTNTSDNCLKKLGIKCFVKPN